MVLYKQGDTSEWMRDDLIGYPQCLNVFFLSYLRLIRRRNELQKHALYIRQFLLECEDVISGPANQALLPSIVLYTNKNTVKFCFQ